MSQHEYDIIIIGGGIVGMATAMAVLKKYNQSLAVIEAESDLAAHQTGNNSGVVHSGLYYKPGSLKAENCVEGRLALYEFARTHNINCDQCGKVVVATDPKEIPKLNDLEDRGRKNGLKGLKRLTPDEIKEYEPYVSGIDGLFVPQTGIIDYTQVTTAFGDIIRNTGGHIHTNTKMVGWEHDNHGMVIETSQGDLKCKQLINCAGLQSDRIARMCGCNPNLQIVPFRGEYYKLIPEKHYLVNNLIYPVPDPQFPFLGVHFTRMINGEFEAGPNAVLAFKREGYTKTSFSLQDTLKFSFYPGFWLMALKHWKMGLGEMYRSISKAAFVRALQRLIPEIQDDDVIAAGAGVRAQALEPSGFLADDFRIVDGPNMIHVLNAPSPAATAAISIGEKIATRAAKNFNW